MNGLYFGLSLFPLVGVNIWHGYLVGRRSPGKKLRTISEHAAENKRLLIAHRIIHTLSGTAFIIFSVGYLLPSGHKVAAIALIIGGVFDSVESLVLNKESAKRWTIKEPHQITSWAMGGCYLIYGIIIANISGLSLWFSNSIWVLFIVLLARSVNGRFKDFWITQMLYFIFLGTIILIAHARLLA